MMYKAFPGQRQDFAHKLLCAVFVNTNKVSVQTKAMSLFVIIIFIAAFSTCIQSAFPYSGSSSLFTELLENQQSPFIPEMNCFPLRSE